MRKLIQTIFALLLVLSWQSTAQSQTQSFSQDQCAVSVDIWLLGESCVMAGLKARYGEYMAVWTVNDAETGDSIAAVFLRNRLFPITIASRPTDFGWIEGQPYIDFSLVDRINTSSVDLNSTQGSIFDYKTTAGINISEFLDDAALFALSLDGYDLGNPEAQIIYQYLRLGYTLRTPWPWMKFTYGVAVGYHYLNFDFYFSKGDGNTRYSFFNTNEEYFGLLRFGSLALYEGESLNVLKMMVLSQDTIDLSTTNRELTLGHAFLSLEFLSWSFYF